MYEGEEQLFKQYRRNKDSHIRRILYERYKHLITTIALEQEIKDYQLVDLEDLISFGAFGLLDAIERFDVNRKVCFKTYAINRIKGAIKDELEENVFSRLPYN